MLRYDEVGEFKPFLNVSLVRMKKEKGERIPKHSHPNEEIVFTCIKGKVEMTLDNDVEVVSQGESLAFDGNCVISGIFLEDGEVVVTLIKKAP